MRELALIELILLSQWHADSVGTRCKGEHRTFQSYLWRLPIHSARGLVTDWLDRMAMSPVFLFS